MKRILFSTFLSFATTVVALAQPSTAMDWTKNDCNSGTEHHLFSELESGRVIIQEYVMMACTPCVTAGNVIKSILNQYESSNPGKVKGYQTVFENTTDCTTMNEWATDNNFNTSTQFIQGAAEVTYYGGMGMPTTVVLGGGSQHKVYYVHQGSISSAVEQNKLEAAIDSALAESFGTGVEQVGNALTLKVYPNPTTDQLTVKLTDDFNDTEVVVSDATGKEIMNIPVTSPVVRLNVSGLSKGFYVVSVKNATQTLATAQFVKE